LGALNFELLLQLRRLFFTETEKLVDKLHMDEGTLMVDASSISIFDIINSNESHRVR
jgi:hypothetical protein